MNIEKQPNLNEEGQKPEETSPESQEQEATGKLRFLNEDELNTTLKEAKARGGEGEPVFENLQEEMAARASAVRRLSKRVDELRRESSKPLDYFFYDEAKAEEIEEVKGKMFEAVRLRDKHAEQILGILSKDITSKEDCRMVLDYSDELNSGMGYYYPVTRCVVSTDKARSYEIPFKLGAADFKDRFPFSFNAKQAALEKLSEKIEIVDKKRTREISEIIETISILMTNLEGVDEEKRELLKSQALAELVHLAQSKDEEDDPIRRGAFVEIFKAAISDPRIYQEAQKLIQEAGDKDSLSDFVRATLDLNEYRGEYGYPTLYSQPALEMLSALFNKADGLSPEIKDGFVRGSNDSSSIFYQIKRIRDHLMKGRDSGEVWAEKEKQRPDSISARPILNERDPQKFWELLKKYSPNQSRELEDFDF